MEVVDTFTHYCYTCSDTSKVTGLMYYKLHLWMWCCLDFFHCYSDHYRCGEHQPLLLLYIPYLNWYVFFLKRLPYSSPARCIIFWSPFSTLLRFRLFVIYHKCHFTDLCSPHSFHRSVCVNTVWKSRPHSQRWINIGIEKANAFTVWSSRCVNWLQIEKKQKNLNEIFTKRFATDPTTDRFNLYLSFISSRPEMGEANWCH